MGVVQGDLIRIVDEQEYLGEQVLNVYYYRYILAAPATNDIYPALYDEFVETVMTPVAGIQTQQLVHTNVRIVNMSNGVDFYEESPDMAGDLAGTDAECLPSYVSVGFMLIRESLVTRNGYKRFAGQLDTAVTGNTYILSSTLTDAVEAALAADIQIGAINTFEPVIVKSPIGSPPVGAYQYSSIGSAQLRGVGTQNTRKPNS